MNLLPSGSFKIPTHWPTWAKHAATAFLYLTCWIWIPAGMMCILGYFFIWLFVVAPYVGIHKAIWGAHPSWYTPVEHSTGNGFE